MWFFRSRGDEEELSSFLSSQPDKLIIKVVVFIIKKDNSLQFLSTICSNTNIGFFVRFLRETYVNSYIRKMPFFLFFLSPQWSVKKYEWYFCIQSVLMEWI